MSRSTKNPPTDPLESTKATGNPPSLIIKTTANPLPFLYTCHHGHAPGQQAALVLAAQGSSDHGDQLVQGASLAGDGTVDLCFKATKPVGAVMCFWCLGKWHFSCAAKCPEDWDEAQKTFYKSCSDLEWMQEMWQTSLSGSVPAATSPWGSGSGSRRWAWPTTRRRRQT